VDFGDAVLGRGALNLILDLAIPQDSFKGDELPILESLGELREIPPGVDVMPFGAGFVVAFVVLPALLGCDVENDVLAVVLSGLGFCVRPDATDGDDFVEHGVWLSFFWFVRWMRYMLSRRGAVAAHFRGSVSLSVLTITGLQMYWNRFWRPGGSTQFDFRLSPIGLSAHCPQFRSMYFFAKLLYNRLLGQGIVLSMSAQFTGRSGIFGGNIGEIGWAC